jgi:hypothetical protein
MIPCSAFIRVERGTGAHRNHRFSLWVPLFLAWILLLPLFLILFPIAAVACVFARINVLRLYAAGWGILTGLRKTRVEVSAPTARVLVNIA